MKTISAFTRRNDLSRAAFRDYYETRHAPLGMTYFPFTKYVRNHVVEPGPGAFDLDCISEFYVDDWSQSAELTRAATGELFADDERQFMDRRRIAAAVVMETLIQGPPRGVDRSQVRRRMLAFDLASGDGRPTAALRLQTWAARLPMDGRRVTLDLTVGFAGDAFPYNTPFPYDALVSIWSPDASPADLPPPPEGAVLAADLIADICESPPEEIAARFASTG